MAKHKKKQALDMFSLGAMSSEDHLPKKDVSTKKKKRSRFQLRILPITIIAAALFLTVRANEVWKDFSIGTLYAQQPPASSPAAPAPAAATAPVPVTQGTPSPAAAAPPAAAASGVDEAALSPNELDVLQKLAVRREELEARERELDRREANLKAAALKIDEKIGQLKSLQTEVDSLLKKYNQQEDEKMRSLVRIYENMKPKEAARIFEQLDMPILLDVIERMKEQKFAPILAEMDVRKASALSAEMAQRRQLPPPSVSGG